MPQNIQKRLLLYVLHQLSVFSEIDLPNLEEVSLNNILLRDVSLDPEKVGKLPGFNLRYGKVGTLEVNGGVMGGVTIDAKDVEVVLAPSFDNRDVPFSLAQSTADLANMMESIDDDSEAQNDSDDTDDGDHNNDFNETNETNGTGDATESPDHSEPKRSTLGGVMARAVEMALQKLLISFTNIVIKVVLEDVDIAIHVATARMSTTDGVKHFTIESIGVSTLKPYVQPGDGSHDKEADDTVQDEEDSHYDSSPNSEEGSELMDSMVFTHEEASSIYMSATSRSFSKAEPGPTLYTGNKPSRIAHVDKVTVKFEGLSEISNLNVEIGNIRLAASPIIPTLASIITSLATSYRMSRPRNEEKRNEKFPQYTDDDESPDTSDGLSALDEISVESIQVSISSALDVAGNFSALSHMTLSFDKIKVQQRVGKVIFGKVDLIAANWLHGENILNILCFKEISEKKRSDFRFEFSFENEDQLFTLLLPKPCTIVLDSKSVLALSVLLLEMSSVFEALDQMPSARRSSSQPQSKDMGVNLQTSTISLSLILDNSVSIGCMIYPVSLSTKERALTISRAGLTMCRVGQAEIPLISVHTIDYKLSGQNFSTFVRSRHNSKSASRTSSVDSAKAITVHKVSGMIMYADLCVLMQSVQTFMSLVEIPEPPLRRKLSSDLKPELSMSVSHFIPGRRRGGMSTIFSTNPRNISSSLSIHVDKIKIALEFDDVFGSLELILDSLVLFKSRDEFHGSLQHVLSMRRTPNVTQHFVSDVTELTHAVRRPFLLFNYRDRGKLSILDIHLNRIKIEYYALWVSLLSKFDSSISTSTESLNVSKKRLDISISSKDCAIGLSPGRLSSKCIATLEGFTSDVQLVDGHWTVKTTMKDIRLHIVDDIANLKRYHHQKDSEPSPLDFFRDIGYVPVGVIDTLHFSIATSQGENLKVEVKVNADELRLDVCADSSHTLAQLLSDMTDPRSLEENEKSKVQLDEGVNLLSDLVEEFMVPVSKDVPGIELGLGSLQLANSGTGLSIREDHFGIDLPHHNGDESKINIHLNLGKAVLFLFDGYDWKLTRKGIKSAIRRVEEELVQSTHKDANSGAQQEPVVTFDTGSGLIEQTLYQSIHLSVPVDGSANILAARINDQVLSDKRHDAKKSQKPHKNLQLRRSTSHKIKVDVTEVSADIQIFSTRDPKTEKYALNVPFELMQKIDLKIHTCDIIDNVLSSTWNKFLTYMNILGAREQGSHMARLRLEIARPDPSLIAAEAVVDLELLPVRMYIDQDTLDFLNRFLEFQDVRFELPPDEILFIQRFSLGPLRLKVDYKPKTIDFTGMRSGNAAEFMNIFVLDGSDLQLPRTVVYGLAGLPKVGPALGRVWGPVIQLTQMSGLLSGIAPLKSFVSLGGGFKDLVAIPIAEYKKDGRLVSGVRKGTFAFAKTTAAELLRLGAKISSGTQALLENSEEYFGGDGALARAVLSKLPTVVEDDERDVLYAMTTRKTASDIMAKSQLLQKRTGGQKDMHQKPRSYLFADIDESSEFDPDVLHEALVNYDMGESGLYASASEVADDPESDGEAATAEKKVTSLYSNQPETSKDGLLSAYQSMGRNLGTTGQTFNKLRDEVTHADTVPDSLAAIAKSSPALLMRPIIGTTEALLKVLMGLSNEIDDRYLIENKDKYKEGE